MMARVGRLGGAILAETKGEFYLVGNTKVPCDFCAAGFETPIKIDALRRPFVRLSIVEQPFVAPPYLVLETDGSALLALLVRVFLIDRTGSVSERLWRLVMGHIDAADEASVPEVVDAGWLAAMPEPIWQLVRSTVLRCT